MLMNKFVAKIGDLGSAKSIIVSRRPRLNTMVPGTAVFMPPEAFSESCKYDITLDVFSFGGVIVYVATEEWPLPRTQNFRKFSKLERWENYLDKMTGEMAVLRKLAEECLDNDSTARPIIDHVCEEIDSLMVIMYSVNFVSSDFLL